MVTSFTTTTAEELWDRIGTAHRRFVDLSRSLPAEAPVAGSDWDNRELVGHLVTVLRRYTGRDLALTTGLAATPREVDLLNARELAALGDRNLADLLDDLGSELASIRADLGPEKVDLRQRFEFHGGVDIDGAAGLANLIGEFLIHGRDLARAAGRPWTLDRRDAELVVNHVMQVVPAYVRRDRPGSLSVELRAPGTTRWYLGITDGQGSPGRPVRSTDPTWWSGCRRRSWCSVSTPGSPCRRWRCAAPWWSAAVGRGGS